MKTRRLDIYLPVKHLFACTSSKIPRLSNENFAGIYVEMTIALRHLHSLLALSVPLAADFKV